MPSNAELSFAQTSLVLAAVVYVTTLPSMHLVLTAELFRSLTEASMIVTATRMLLNLRMAFDRDSAMTVTIETIPIMDIEVGKHANETCL